MVFPLSHLQEHLGFYHTSRLCFQSHKQHSNAGRKQAHCLLAEECVRPSALLHSVGACREGSSTKHLLNLWKNLIWLGFLLLPLQHAAAEAELAAVWAPAGAGPLLGLLVPPPLPRQPDSRATAWLGTRKQKYCKWQHNPQVRRGPQCCSVCQHLFEQKIHPRYLA